MGGTIILIIIGILIGYIAHKAIHDYKIHALSMHVCGDCYCPKRRGIISD